MSVHLYLAPAANGKTTYVLKLAQRRAKGLQEEVRVCVPSRLQAASWRRRLAADGGTIGVRVMTFDQLYGACLDEARESYTRLSQPVQYRLIRNIIEKSNLVHYASLRDRPGFVRVLSSFIEELKGAQIFPEQFEKAVIGQGNEPRLWELGQVYKQYQAYLHEHDWADYAGKGWLAVEALETRAPEAGREWPLLIVDGFDDFTQIQLALLQQLAGRVGSLVVTMTGECGRDEPRAVHRRFHYASRKLESRLAITAEPLPEMFQHPSPVIAHLESDLFSGLPLTAEAASTITMIEAPDRATEARSALRWLKERLNSDNDLGPGDVALIARDLNPYRPFIVDTATEFGLPIRLTDGLPLRSNPAIVALLNLLRLVLPPQGKPTEFALPRTGVVAAWRSPYFDWMNALPPGETTAPIGITPADADALDMAARWGRVIGGYAHWQEALAALAGRNRHGSSGERNDLPDNVVAGDEAKRLEKKFVNFFLRILPPQGKHPHRDFVIWLEDLIGSDRRGDQEVRESKESDSLNMVAQINEVDKGDDYLDLAALRKLKEILRGLVWAEAAAGEGRLVDYPGFINDLTGAIESTSYEMPLQPGQEGILVANVIRARGLPFQAVALLGLAEGEFPAVLSEDPFLRESDRMAMAQQEGLPLTSSIASAEREFFYEIITSTREQLLLTRPRLSESGAEWLASPFWEEIRRLVPVKVIKKTTESVPEPFEAASLPELLECLVTNIGHRGIQAWVQENQPEDWLAVEQAGQIFHARYQQNQTHYDGDLRQFSPDFTAHYNPEYRWSPSSLEGYLSCALKFFIGRTLGLQPRQEPTEGFDVGQRGTIYHDILEAVYAGLQPADRRDTDKLLAILPAVAAPILEAAPQKHGFREVAWWQHIKQEILENISRTILALAEIPGDFVPAYFELPFRWDNPLVVIEGKDQFRVHGIVDRVDKDPYGNVRIIDYKTSGSAGFTKKSLEQGEKLQLPLYALAARDALGLGDPIEGFYWHIAEAGPSALTLGDFGPQEAMQTAVDYAWEVIHGARQGDFRPSVPANGCPEWCPAASFCWQYRAKAWR